MTETPVNLLFIEDSRDDVQLALLALERDGVRPSWKHVATEMALREALKSSTPDAILSDFSMPEFDGLAALRIARDFAPRVPFIFVSGTIGEERAIEAIRLGATDYVLKDNLRRLGTALRRAWPKPAIASACARRRRSAPAWWRSWRRPAITSGCPTRREGGST